MNVDRVRKVSHVAVIPSKKKVTKCLLRGFCYVTWLKLPTLLVHCTSAKLPVALIAVQLQMYVVVLWIHASICLLNCDL